jgi:hypothetical protein
VSVAGAGAAVPAAGYGAAAGGRGSLAGVRAAGRARDGGSPATTGAPQSGQKRKSAPSVAPHDAQLPATGAPQA